METNDFSKGLKNLNVADYVDIDENYYIEYEVYKKFRNNGYATEMLIAIKNHCLANGIIPHLYIDQHNLASKRTATKAEFEYEEPYDKYSNNEKWGLK